MHVYKDENPLFNSVMAEVFTCDENGQFETEFFKNKEDVLVGRDKTTGFGKWLVGSLFCTGTYEKHMGSLKTPVFCNTVAGVLPFYPTTNPKIRNFIDDQGPGCCDLCIPLRVTIDDKVYIYTGDGTIGDSIIVCSKDEYNRKQVTEAIADLHLEDFEDDDED